MTKMNRRLFRYFTRVFLVFAGTTFLAFIIFMLLYHIFQDEKEMRVQAEKIRGFTHEHLQNSSDVHEMEAYIRALNHVLMMDTYFIKGEGEEFVCACGCGCKLSDQPEAPSDVRSFADAVFKDGEYTFIRKGSLAHPFLYYAGLPVVLENRVAAVIVLRNETGFTMNLCFIPILLLICYVAIAMPISFFFSSRMTELFLLPIHKIVGTVKELAGGNYQARTQVEDSTEIGILADATDYLAGKLAEAQENQERHAQMQKEFFATISHELRTPVSVIRSYAEALIDGIIPENRLKDYYGQIFSEILSLQRFVDDMLEFSRLETNDFKIEMEPVDVGVILEDAIRSASLIASRKQINIRFHNPGEEIIMQGDYGRLKQMFLIVIDNAIKYSDSGTDILINTMKRGKQYEVSIHDEGQGIREEELELVFTRFYSTSDNGSGLGLAIMKSIAKRHGIEVTLESSPGNGTTITFLFPYCSYTIDD